jgi:hypothetical protein
MTSSPGRECLAFDVCLRAVAMTENLATCRCRVGCQGTKPEGDRMIEPIPEFGRSSALYGFGKREQPGVTG